MSRALFHMWFRAIGILLLGLCAWPLSAADTADPETTLRAAFLNRLVDFVEWPEDRFAGRQPVIRFCVGAAPAPLLRELERAAARRKSPQRPLQVVALDGASACELIYLSDVDAATRVPDAGTLIVADSAGTLRRIGHLALVLQAGRGDRAKLIFRGDRQRIATAQLTLSAKFLALVRFDG